MKTILAPTDFSPVSVNAINYAAEIAKIAEAKLVLLHVYHVPDVPSVIPILLSADEIEKDAMDALAEIGKEIRLKHGNDMVIECRCRCGVPTKEINLFAEQNNAFLIVMGMESIGYVAEKFIGSTTTSLMREAKCPVLAIDKSVKFKSIKRIALACDYEKTKTGKLLEPLKVFVRLFNSHVYIVNVVPEMESVSTVSKAVEGIKIGHALEEVFHSFHYSKNENVVLGLNDFIEEKNIDMMVMVPRAHSGLKSLFQEPNTKRMAFHTNVPLLTLHE